MLLFSEYYFPVCHITPYTPVLHLITSTHKGFSRKSIASVDVVHLFIMTYICWCFFNEEVRRIGICIPVYVFYWIITNHYKVDGLKQWHFLNSLLTASQKSGYIVAGFSAQGLIRPKSRCTSNCILNQSLKSSSRLLNEFSSLQSQD